MLVASMQCMMCRYPNTCSVLGSSAAAAAAKWHPFAPYLNPRREVDLSPSAALLRIMADRVAEGVARRRVDVLARQDHAARLLAENERDEAQAAIVAERVWRCARPA